MTEEDAKKWEEHARAAPTEIKGQLAAGDKAFVKYLMDGGVPIHIAFGFLVQLHAIVAEKYVELLEDADVH